MAEMDVTEQESGFILDEIQGDLFSCPDSDSLCHCVSKDMVMGKGIAVHFKNKFGQVDVLKKQNRNVGEVANLKIFTKNPAGGLTYRFVYYMITKGNYFNKPTLESMEKTLVYLRDLAIRDGVKVISMPTIGCGLDRLEWSDVKALIIKVFQNTSIKIKVYHMG